MVKKAYPSGLLYLCQTKREPYTYSGSGVRWEHHIRKHKPRIVTCVLGTYETMEELRESGLYYSRLFNVVESDEWANLREEDGTGGGAGKVGRRWKVKDTSNMKGPKDRTSEAVSRGYDKLRKENNHQFKGWYVTPWGKFASLVDATKEAKRLRENGSTQLLLTDINTLRRYCCKSGEPLSCTPRIPKDRQGKKPIDFGFTFIENTIK